MNMTKIALNKLNNRELYNHFKFQKVIPTASAFVRARAKVLPEAFQYLFHKFNNKCFDNKLYKGYRLLAVEGTDLNIPKNPNDKAMSICSVQI